MPHDCPRCDGLLVREDSHLAYEGRTEKPIPLLRCINCGNRLDPVISFHRLVNRSRPVRGYEKIAS